MSLTGLALEANAFRFVLGRLESKLGTGRVVRQRGFRCQFLFGPVLDLLRKSLPFDFVETSFKGARLSTTGPTVLRDEGLVFSCFNDQIAP